MADISKFHYEGSGVTYNLKDAQAREKLEEVSTKANSNETRLNNLVASTGDSNSEIVDARIDFEGKQYKNLYQAVTSADKKVIEKSKEKIKINEYYKSNQTNKILSSYSGAIETKNFPTTSTSFCNVNVGSKFSMTDYSSGSSEYLFSTGLLDIDKLPPFLYVSSRGQGSVSNAVLFDSNEICVGSLGHKVGSSDIIDWDNEVINTAMLQELGVKYIVLQSYRLSAGIKCKAPKSNKRDIVYSTTSTSFCNSTVGSKFSMTNYSSGSSEYLFSTGLLDIDKLPPFLYVSSRGQGSVSNAVLFDSNEICVGSLGHKVGSSDIIDWDNEVINMARLQELGVKYIVLQSYRLPAGIKFKEESFSYDLSGKCSSPLEGKKWVACGDSFTDNNFNGPTYPKLIGDRNNMTVINEAISGTACLKRNDTDNDFSIERYKKVPYDADYVTLAFGLNEIDYINSETRKGTEESYDIETLWGAYNTVIDYILTNNPTVKLGIIIMDGWMTDEMANFQKAVARRWGLPYLDLKFDEKLPSGTGGRTGMCEKAITIRNGVFSKGGSDGSNLHPSQKGHVFRSYIIENWLKSI